MPRVIGRNGSGPKSRLVTGNYYPKGFYVDNAMGLPDTTPIETETAAVVVTNPTAYCTTAVSPGQVS